MNRRHIIKFLLCLLFGISRQCLAQPVDTVWIEQCVFNELHAEGIESPTRVWLRAPRELYDSILVLRNEPRMKRLEEIGRTIARYPLPDFAGRMILIASIPYSRAGPMWIPAFEQLYDLDYDHDIDRAQFDSAIRIAFGILRERTGWLPGDIYAVASGRTEPSLSIFVAVEWPYRYDGCLEYPRIIRFDFDLLTRGIVRDGLKDAMRDEALRHWDSVVVMVYEGHCTDTSTFHWDWRSPDESTEDDPFAFELIAIPRNPDTTGIEPQKSAEEKRDSAAISSILRNVRWLNGTDSIIYRLETYLSDAFREPYLVTQDARLRAIGFAEGCERRLVSQFAYEATWDTVIWRDWRKDEPFRYFEECLPANTDSIWLRDARRLIDSLQRELSGVPERFFVVRKDGELSMVIGFPANEAYGTPLVLKGKELTRTLDAMPKEQRERLLREVRYKLCGIERFFRWKSN